MFGDVLQYTGAALIFVWGAAHIAALKPVVAGFGPLSTENRRIIALEWTAEGLTLCFLGVLALLVTLLGSPTDAVTAVVLRAVAVMLFAMAGLSAATGARSSIVPMRLCPFVKTAVGVLLVVGSAV